MALRARHAAFMKSGMVIAAAALLLSSGCSKASKPQVTPSSTLSVTSTASSHRSAVYREAAAYLQSFLASWQMNGLYAAGQKYLDPAQRLPGQTQGNLMLIAGTVTRTQSGEWVSADHFTVQADLDLRFSGDTGAWGEGTNTRFVTFVRSSASAPYQITFATSP